MIRSRIIEFETNCSSEAGRDRGYPNITDHADNISVSDKARFDEILYCGVLNRKSTVIIADELAWKWSETTGKYIGCPFWSARAEELFNSEMQRCIGRQSLQAAWRLAHQLSANNRNPEKQLTHEHVYPKQFFCKILGDLAESSSVREGDLHGFFSRLAVGCVVLESEHPTNQLKNEDNPWLRYCGITLAANPAWPIEHQQLIAEAGLQVT